MVKLEFTIRLPDTLNRELAERAKQESISKNALIIRAVRQLLKVKD